MASLAPGGAAEDADGGGDAFFDASAAGASGAQSSSGSSSSNSVVLPGPDLHVTDGALQAVAEMALKKGTGACGGGGAVEWDVVSGVEWSGAASY
jgi:hypothetical protein